MKKQTIPKPKCYSCPFCETRFREAAEIFVYLNPERKPVVRTENGQKVMQVFYSCGACGAEFMAKYKPASIKCPNCGAEIDDFIAFNYGCSAIYNGYIYAKVNDGIPNVWYTVVRCYEEDCGELMFFPWVLDEPPEFWEVKYVKKVGDSEDGDSQSTSK
ncbi:MAG: hypothetical protein DRN20_03465 [Thermoplasmata archaeon]|nr:MAG: hypothetical protein DRN20_03465 [Thermoplasmata archaeon]